MNDNDLNESLNRLTSYELFQNTTKYNDYDKQSIKNIHSENPVSALFFSQHNIDTLQNGIRYMVYKKTNNTTVIDNQSENELLIIMRSIYLQYSSNKNYEIVAQIKELNTKVLDYAVPLILVGVNQYINYKMDASQLPVPLEHSRNVSPKGTKVLYTKDF